MRSHRPNSSFAALAAVLVWYAGILGASVSDTTAADPLPKGQQLRIRHVTLHGNRHTSAQIVRHFFAVDTGEVYDSTEIAAASRRLAALELFTKVNVFPTFKADGVDLHVLLTESPRLVLSDLGAELIEGRYGLDRYDGHWWLRAGFGIKDRNFRGKMEQLQVKLSFFRDRRLQITWAKQFIGTPYFVSFGAGASHRPDRYIPLNRFSVYQTSTIGRRLGSGSKLYATMMPSYSSRTRARLSDPPTSLFEDSLLNTIEEEAFRELLLLLGWSTSFGTHLGFDPANGVRLEAMTHTNALLPRDNAHSYFQLDTDSRLYHRGFSVGSKFAYRLSTSTRLDTAGVYDGLYAGGVGGPRGWGDGALGLRADHVANNRVVAGIEYRTPLLTTPTISFNRLAIFHEGLREFYYRLDGALFVDAAYLWHRLEQPLSGGHDYGIGVGAGLRVLAPTIERSICLDFAWPVAPGRYRESAKELAGREAVRTRRYAELRADSGIERFANRLWARYHDISPYLPAFHLYLDLPF